MPRIPKPMPCDCHVPVNASEDFKLKVLQSNLEAQFVPKDIKNKILEDLKVVSDTDYIFVDNNGSPAKISTTILTAQAKAMRFEYVQVLPTLGEQNVIYLLPVVDQSGNNVCEEYIFLHGEWKKIGTTAINMSLYRTAAQQAAIDQSILEVVATKQDNITDLETIRAGSEAGATAVQPNQRVSLLYNDAGYITENALTSYAKKTEVAADIAAEKDERVAADNNEATLRANADQALTNAVALKANTADVYDKTTVDTKLNTKQNKLTAGSNIRIENNIISALEAKMGRSFTTNTKVGHLDSGTDIAGTDTIGEVLYKILYKASPDTVIVYFGAVNQTPVSLEGLISKTVDRNVLLDVTGYNQHITAGDSTTENAQYVTFAVPDNFVITHWQAVGFPYDIPCTLVHTGGYNIYYLNSPSYDEPEGIDYEIFIEEA